MKVKLNVDPKIKIKNIHDVVTLPIVVTVNEFTDKSAKIFSDQMNEAANTGQEIIPVVIDSFGGQVYSLISMMSTIENCIVPVATICLGKCMSAGAALLTCGSPGLRFMDRNSHVMIHDVASSHGGKNEEVQSSAKQLDFLQNQILTIMAKNCKKDEDYFKKLIHDKGHADWYLNANQCKKHNIIDNIAIPYFNFEIKVKNTFTWNKNGSNNTNRRTK